MSRKSNIGDEIEIKGKKYVGLDAHKSNVEALLEEIHRLRDEIVKLKSELEAKENLLKIKNGLCRSFDCLPSEPISVANMLINAKTERELDAKYLVDKYSIDDLGQIAEHLLVYCKHNREDEEKC